LRAGGPEEALAALLFCSPVIGGRIAAAAGGNGYFNNSKGYVGHWADGVHRADGGHLGQEKSFAGEVFRP
jgi:hypothetical protein